MLNSSTSKSAHLLVTTEWSLPNCNEIEWKTESGPFPLRFDRGDYPRRLYRDYNGEEELKILLQKSSIPFDSLSLSLRVRSMRKRDFGFQRRSEGLNTEKKKSTKATSTSPDTCPPGDRKVAYAVCRWSWRLLESWAPLHVAWGNPCLPQSAKCWNTLTWPKPFLPGGQFFPDNYKVNHLLLFRYYLINLYLISIWSNKKK